MSAKASRPVLKTSRAGDRPAESTAPAGHQALELPDKTIGIMPDEDDTGRQLDPAQVAVS